MKKQSWWEDNRAIGLKCIFWDDNEENTHTSLLGEVDFKHNFSYTSQSGLNFKHIELIQGDKTPYDGKGQPVPDGVFVKIYFHDGGILNQISQKYKWDDVNIVYYQVLCLEKACDDTPNTTKSAPLKNQIGGNHYKDMAIQPIEFTMKNNLNFCQGNIIKYACRYKAKNGKEDLLKIKHYVDLLIEMEYK